MSARPRIQGWVSSRAEPWLVADTAATGVRENRQRRRTHRGRPVGAGAPGPAAVGASPGIAYERERRPPTRARRGSMEVSRKEAL